MITAVRQYTVQGQQKQNFGSIRTAGNTVDDVIFALASKNPAERITEATAIERLKNAMKSEDNIGKKIIQNFIDTVINKK